MKGYLLLIAAINNVTLGEAGSTPIEDLLILRERQSRNSFYCLYIAGKLNKLEWTKWISELYWTRHANKLTTVASPCDWTNNREKLGVGVLCSLHEQNNCFLRTCLYRLLYMCNIFIYISILNNQWSQNHYYTWQWSVRFPLFYRFTKFNQYDWNLLIHYEFSFVPFYPVKG